MDREIKRISSQSTHQICSAQVITSCESVIKELIENSLDAGATNIEVRLQNYGLDLIEVIDNGGGIASSDFDGITLKHHTSKLRQFDGLLSVKTFGFRGEALSSLCAVSELSIHTYNTSDPTGTLLCYDHDGCVESQLAKPRQPGTTVSARNLFRQFPVRLKEMQKTGQRELKACARCVTAYALVHTGIKFCLSHQSGQSGKRTVALKTSGCGSLDDCIATLFTASQAKSLLPLSSPSSWLELLPDDQRPTSLTASQRAILDQMGLSGRISSPLPGMGRPSGDRQFFNINGRPCHLPRLARLANEVYKLYNRTQQPFLFLDLQLPTDAIDINLTPDKRSIYLSHEHLLAACLRAYLHQQLDLANGCLSMPVRSLPGQDASDSPMASQASAASADSAADLADSSSSGANSPTTICRSQSPVQPEAPEPQSSSTDLSAAADAPGSRQLSALERLRADYACSTSRAANSSSMSSATSPKKVSAANRSARSPPRKKQKSLSAFWPTAAASQRAETASDDEESFCSERTMAADEPDDKDSASAEMSSDIRPAEDFVLDDCPEFGGSEDPALTVASRTRLVCRFQPDRLLQLYGNGGGGGQSAQSAADADESSRHFRARIRPEESAAAEAELRARLDRAGLRRLRPVGQFNLGFLPCLLDSTGDAFLVDQHAADEKCRFEALQRDPGHLTRQPLAAPKQLRLTFDQEETAAAALPRFSAARFDLQFDSEAPVGSRLRLLSVPLGLGKWRFGLPDLEELIELVSAEDGGGGGGGTTEDAAPMAPPLLPSRVRAMLASRACRSAVMIGDALDARQQARIVANLAELDQPWNCPHGRPTIRHLLHLPDALKSVPLYPD